MLSPYMLLLLFFHVSCIVVHRCHNKTTTTFFNNCHKSEKCFNFEKKKCFACQLVQFRGCLISYAAKVSSVKKRFQSVVIFIPIFLNHMEFFEDRKMIIFMIHSKSWKQKNR